MHAHAGPPRRRPRDRREHVARHARALFAERGFHAVRMEDIAAAVGVTARALYRHFPNKRALLTHVATASQDAYFTALELGGPPDRALPDLAGRLVRINLEDPSHALLWQREARHLEEEHRREVQQRVVEVARGVGAVVAAARDEQPGTATETLAWAVLAVASSQGHDLALQSGFRHDQLLVAAAVAVARAPLPGADADGPEPYLHEPALSSRRERLLHSSARLFRRRGFLGVTLEEIGEQAGIHGPSIYHHFPNKLSILDALIDRLHEWIILGELDARGRGNGHEHTLALSVRAYVSLALRFPDLISVSLTESIYLTDEGQRDPRVHDGLVTEWAAALRSVRPELEPAAAAVLVRAAKANIDDLVRIPHLRPTDLGARLIAMTHAVLGAVDPSAEPQRSG